MKTFRLLLITVIVTWTSVGAVTVPDQDLNYAYLYFEHGYPTRYSSRRPQSEADFFARANPDLVFQTGYYSLMLDCDDMTIKGYDALTGSDYVSALSQDVVQFTPAQSLYLRVTQGGIHYTCTNAVVNASGIDNVRLIESGQYLQRIDHKGLVFKDDNGNTLSVDDDCRLEISAWPDRVTFFLDFSAETANPITRTTIQLVSPGSTTHLADTMANQVRLTLAPQDDAELGSLASGSYITEATNLQDGAALATTFDADVHGFRVDVPADSLSYPADKGRVDEYMIEVTNPLGTAQNIPLVFKQPSVRAVIGTTMLLSEEIDGRPLGIPVQVSKNWHRDTQNPTVHEGTWLRGSTLLALGPNETRRLKLRVVYGYWGNSGAASHAQLSLIGYGGNWKWDQTALGSWGEQFTYDPTAHLGGAFMDDIRPAWTTSYGTGSWYGWTENVGGGDFLIYRDSSDTYRWGKRQKTCYNWVGPNMTEVLYSGISNDDKIRFTYNTRSVRTSDYHRRFHDYKYEFLQDVTDPSRLVFMQMEADYYNTATFTDYHIGDENGLLASAVIESGGDVYKGSPVLMDGKWLSVDDELGGSETAHALRGIIPLSSTLNGNPLPIYMHKYGISSDMCFDFTASTVTNSYSAGDVVEGQFEFIMPPKESSSYWGDDVELVNRLNQYGISAWETVRDELVHNLQMDVVMEAGTLLQNYPIEIDPASVGKVLADFTITSGGLGHVPVVLRGAPAGLELKAQRWTDGQWAELSDVNVADNNYYQAIVNPDGTADYVFNIARPNLNLLDGWRIRIIESGNVLDPTALASVTSGGLDRDDYGFRKSSGSAWTVSNGVLSNSSLSNNNEGEGCLGMSVDLSTLPYDSKTITLSFDYTTDDPNEKLHVHLWGYVDVNSTPTSWLMNLGAQNGNAWESSGSSLTGYNLGKPNGVFQPTAGVGSDCAAILTGSTGSQRYTGTFDLSTFTTAPNSIGGYDYLVLGFAREIGGATTPAVTISDIALTIEPIGPAAPTGLLAQSGIGQVSLDWDDHSDPNVLSYSVYRSASSGSGYYTIASGLSSSDFVDSTAPLTTNYYVVTAWTGEPAESDFSNEVMGTANQPCSFVSNQLTAGSGTEGAPYSGTIAGTATDPEGDAITYSKLSGPGWLTVAADGTLSGTPAIGEGGDNVFTVQASSFGGDDTATLTISLNAINHVLLSSSDVVPCATSWVRLYRNDIGFKKDASSQWVVANGTLSNASADTSKVGTAAVASMVDLSSVGSGAHDALTLSFDYTTADPAEELVVHLWGYTDVSSSSSTHIMNLESTHGHVWESSAGALTPYSFGNADGAFGNGSRADAIAILTGSTGAQSYSVTIDLSAYVTAPATLGGYDYMAIGFARYVSGAPAASVSVSNLSLTAALPEPDAPTALAAVEATGEIQLDWADNTAPDFSSYTVYRSTTSGSGYSVLASGLTSSDFVDNTVSVGTTYYYVVSAWNIHDVQSAMSTEVSATGNAAPVFGNDLYILSVASEGVAYTDSIAGTATDVDGDAISYSKLSGPAWINIASDGAVSGTPGAGDDGIHTFTVQASAVGGTDTASVRLTVNPATDPLTVLALGDLTTAPAMYVDDVSSTPATVSPGETKAVYFDGLDYLGAATRVYAYVGIPAGATAGNPAPGVVLVHGGGGTAFLDWVDEWTSRGYAAISIAVEGQTDTVATQEQIDAGQAVGSWLKHAQPGPARVGIYGDTGVDPINDQWMYHAVADTVLANSLLRSLPEVNAVEVGTMGISWGGVIVSTVIGVDNRFAFAVPTYGCGNLDEQSNVYGTTLNGNSMYEDVWDPMVRIANVTMPVLWYSWPEDWHFALDAQADNYNAAPGVHMVSLVPGMGHGHSSAWVRPESYAFADSVIAGTPWCVQQSATVANARDVDVVFASTQTLDGASIVSTVDTGHTGDRAWTEQTATLVDNGDGTYTISGSLPAYTTAWFVNADSAGVIASSDFQEADPTASATIDYAGTVNWATQYVYDYDNVIVNGDATVTLGQFSAPPELVVNGSFEAPDIAFNGIQSYAVGSGSLTGWTISDTSVWLLDRWDRFGNEPNTVASDGTQYLQLQDSGTSAATISQDISTVVGQHYELSFDYSGVDTTAHTVTLTYSIDGSANSVSYSTGTPMLPWGTETVAFEATAATTTISFTGYSVGGGFYGVGIDNVSVKLRSVVDETLDTLTVNDDAAPSTATLDLAGDFNQLTVTSLIQLGVGTGAGFVNHSVGTVTTPSLVVNASNTGDLSVYTLSGGLLEVNAATVNDLGRLQVNGGELRLDPTVGGGLFVKNEGDVTIAGGLIAADLQSQVAINSMDLGTLGHTGNVTVQSGALQVTNGVVQGVVNLNADVTIQGGDVDLEAQVRIWKDFHVVGDDATINMDYPNLLSGGSLHFTLDESGVSPIVGAGWGGVTNGTLTVDGSAYNGGPATMDLITVAALVDTFAPGNINISGFYANGLIASINQDQVTDKISLVLTANEAPTFNGNPVSTVDATEDSAYSASLTSVASDVEGDAMSFSKISGPAWLSVASDGSLSGTPGNSDVGLNAFTVEVADTWGSSQAILNITVLNVNDAPVFSVDPITGSDATEDAAYNGSIAGTASDVDVGDVLTYSKTSGPAWLTVAGDGTLSGTPSNADVGANAFGVEVSDGTVSVPATLNINVINTNDDPVFTSDPMTGISATANAAYTDSIAGSATDVDAGDVLTYSKVSGPAWLSVAASGALSGTPGNADVGANAFTVEVSDGNGGTDQAVLNIAVDADPNPGIRVTEYYLTTGDFSGTAATVTLDQDLADDYYILVRGSIAGDARSYPDNNYARVSAVPGGKGDLPASGAANQVSLTRFVADADWEGVVTVVECQNAASPNGFTLIDAVETPLTGTSGTDTCASWTDVSKVVLFGGSRGGGASFTAATGGYNQGSSVFVRLSPSGSSTLNWTREAAGETLINATMTTFVVEWGSAWGVQRVNVAGSNGGGGADAVGEYTTAAISSVARDNTWVWGTGTRSDAGIGDNAEACLITLGDGVTQNATESSVAVGSEYTDAYNFDVYVLTHSGVAADHRFVVDGNQHVTDVAVAVDSSSQGARFATVSNGTHGTGGHHPRSIFWARYTGDTEVTISRGYDGQTFPAWVQAIDLSGLNQ